MIESFVVMLREGLEIALVIGIIMVVLRRTQRRDLYPAVFLGLALAIIASVGAAIALSLLPVNRGTYEGAIYLVSALFVASMIWWMHSKSKTLRKEIEKKVEGVTLSSGGRRLRESLALGTFAFLMVFREGAETVMFLSAINISAGAASSSIGAALGIAAAVLFYVLFVRGSLKVNLRRFFVVTEWMLGFFIVQLLINSYHELSETGIFPFVQLVDSIAHNNSFFIAPMLAFPFFIWLSGKKKEDNASPVPASGDRGNK